MTKQAESVCPHCLARVQLEEIVCPHCGDKFKLTWMGKILHRIGFGRVRQLYRLGNRRLNDGQHQKAILYYDKALSLKSDFAMGYVKRASAYSQVGMFVEAHADINRALQLGVDKYVLRDSFEGHILNPMAVIEGDTSVTPTPTHRDMR